MAVSSLSFGSQVDAWVKQTEQRMVVVFRESTQRTVSKAQERIPIDTGFARASIRGSKDSMPPVDPAFKGVKGSAYSYDPGQITVVIATADIDQTIYIGWTASYVGLLELGSSNQAPAGFVGLAAAEWPAIVNEVTQEAKSRAGR